GWLVGRIEHVHVFRTHDARRADPEVVDAVPRRQIQRVADLGMVERTKDRVAVAGNADVPRLAGQGRVLDVACTAVERSVVAAFQHGRLHLDGGGFGPAGPAPAG